MLTSVCVRKAHPRRPLLWLLMKGYKHNSDSSMSLTKQRVSTCYSISEAERMHSRRHYSTPMQAQHKHTNDCVSLGVWHVLCRPASRQHSGFCASVFLLTVYWHFKSLQEMFALLLCMLLLLQHFFFMHFSFINIFSQKAMAQVFVVTAETGVAGIKGMLDDICLNVCVCGMLNEKTALDIYACCSLIMGIERLVSKNSR